MLVPNQLITVKVVGITLDHYRSLGYDVQLFDIIMVPPEHLTNGCKSSVDIICDVCGKLISRPYKRYLKCHTRGYDTCDKCKDKKAKDTCMERYGVETHMHMPEMKEKIKRVINLKYGVDNVSQIDEIKEKKIETCIKNLGVPNPMFSDIVKNKLEETNIERYGCKNPIQNKEIRQKAELTNIKKYGCKSPMQNLLVKQKMQQTNINKYGVKCVLQSEEIKDKISQTNIEKYGAENPFASEEVKQKIKETNLLKYGCEYPSQSPEIRAKVMQTMYSNGLVPASSQQLQLYEIIKRKYPNAELNYPFSSYSLDIFICVNNIKIDVEYDGRYWHQDKQKDIKRDKFLQSRGFKTLRVRSGCLIPDEQELFDSINYLVNTEHHFKEIILQDWKEADENESLLNFAEV